MQKITLKLETKTILIAAFLISAIIRLININVGGPQVMIDDHTLFQGGFFVWFGHAPPQHAYLECWLSGIVSFVTYIVRYVFSHGFGGVINANFASNAYRDFYLFPAPYYAAYRVVLSLIELSTAFVVYKIAKSVFNDTREQYAPALVCILYLFTYDTFWCYLVGRPDTLVAFCGTVGFYLYLKSNYQKESYFFLGAAIAFGMAAGLKLHGAFFAIFISIDLFRELGFKKGIKAVIVLVSIAVFFFFISDGTLIFDPLKYVKARLATYKDDHSLYIKWGAQFLKILKNSGWFIIPLVLSSPFVFFSDKKANRKILSVITLSICWLLLFSSIRQLRGYWMLPALPLFYLSAVYVLCSIKKLALRNILFGCIIAVFLFQAFQVVTEMHSSKSNDLTTWIVKNIGQEEAFYVMGYSVLQLPKNTKCIANVRKFYTKINETDIEKGVPFLYRHLKNWEEDSKLRLLDMLDNKSDTGYTYYSYYEHPLEKFRGIIDLSNMEYIIVQEKFLSSVKAETKDIINSKFKFIGEHIGPGGTGFGLKYSVYKNLKNS